LEKFPENDKEYVQEKLNEIIPALTFDEDDFVYNGGKKRKSKNKSKTNKKRKTKLKSKTNKKRKPKSKSKKVTKKRKTVRRNSKTKRRKPRKQ
jgi:hypothetical protein